MVKDLTKGKPLKLLFFFSFPMLLGNLFQQLYNMVDAMIVGKLVGQDALASVGASFPVIFLALAAAGGMEMGCTVVISQLFGAKRIREMKTTIYTSLISLSVLGIVITVVGELLSAPLLNLLGTDKDIISDSLIYIRIYFGGAVFLFLYNALKGIYTAQGDSKTPLKFLILSTLANIVLDLVFVLVFNMGVAGVAWATLIAQGLSATLSFFVLIKRLSKMEQEEKKAKVFDITAIKKILNVGIPSILQQSVISIGMLCMQGLVNSFGKAFVAGYTAATKINSLSMTPNMNFSNAMSSFTAQNIGAEKYERVNKGFKACFFMAFTFCVIITATIFLFGKNLLGLFLEASAESGAMNYGLSYIKTVSMFYIVMGIMFIGNGLLRGAGDMNFFLISSMSNLASRVIVAYILSKKIGESAIWRSIPIGWCIGSIITLLRIKSGKWKEKKLITKDNIPTA